MTDSVTILCVVRHGHATTPVCIERAYAATRRDVRVVYADVASPPSVESCLADLASARDDFVHLRIDDYVSRQEARRRALAHVDTEFVVLLDNNMLCEPGCIDTLLDVQKETGADVVSPIIVTQGGRVHFSAGTIERKRERWYSRAQVRRPHAQPGAPVRSLLADTNPQRVEIDFAESHCCLMRADDLRLPGVLEPGMHNAHTACYAAYLLKRKYRKKMLLDPGAVASIFPMSFGYDIPWLFRSYMRKDWLDESYRRLEKLVGRGPGTARSINMPWHAKHLKYLLFTMLDRDTLHRDDFMAASEIPDYIDGYDFDLPPNVEQRIEDDLMPQVRTLYPELVDPMQQWLSFR